MGVKVTQTNFTGGVADPLLIGREDQTFYYNSIEEGNNIVIQPQGGTKRRGGLKHVMKLSGILEEIDLSAATVTVPNGGTVANLYDGDESTVSTTTGNLGTTNPFVVAHIDFGAARAVDIIDIIDYYLSSGDLSDEFFVQYSDDDAAWTNFGTAFDWSDTARSRRIKDAVGQVTARYWRVARVGSTSVAATATISELRAFEDTGALSNGRLQRFSDSTREDYMMVASDKNMDVLLDVDWQSAVSINHESSDLAVLNKTQSLDTLILFHNDYEPWKILRQGDDDEFDWRVVPFANIPQHDYGAGVGGTNEVQVLNDGNTLASGDDFTILLDGERTTNIIGGASRAASATNIQTALRALNNTSSTGITVADTGGGGFQVTFSGDDGKKPYLEMSVSVSSGNSVWTTSRTTEGEYPGEDVMSDARGWPRTGAFYQSRLWLGGIDGVPNALIGSVVGITDADGNFDMDITDTDDDAIGVYLTADTDDVSAIYQIVGGRNLTVFTEDTEFYIPTEPITIDAVLKMATRRGIKEGLSVFEMDGALVFLQADGSSLREFIFVDTEQSYEANNISVLSSHLIQNPVDVGLRKAVNTDETDLLILVNDDGTAAVLSALRKELVNAFTAWQTRDGDTLLNVGVDKQKRVYFIVERNINGVTRRFVEMMDSDYLLDGGGKAISTYESFTASADQTEFIYTFDNPAVGSEAVGVRINGARLDPSEYAVDTGTKTVTLNEAALEDDIVRIASMVKVISGLDYLAGEDIYTYIDGSPGGTYTVSEAGVLTLDNYADISVEYGFFFEPYIKLMDVRIAGNETLAGKKMGVYRAILQLYETGHIEIRCNGGAWREVPLQKFDNDILDKSLDEVLFSGTADLKGITGFGEGGTLEIRQSVPAPLNILSITREVKL